MLPKFAVSIYDIVTREHVLKTYNAESDVVAAYIVCGNEVFTEFEDNDARATFSIDEAKSEFMMFGLSLEVIKL